jgi:hypothetical protein
VCYTNHALDQFLEALLDKVNNITARSACQPACIATPHASAHAKLPACPLITMTAHCIGLHYRQGIKDIVRVGSRSKSQRLEEYNLTALMSSNAKFKTGKYMYS